MKTLFTLSFVLCTFSHSHAQITFQKTYGGIDDDQSHSVQQTTDGGYIITGETHSFGASFADVYFIKTDPVGYTLWIKTYAGINSDYSEAGMSLSELLPASGKGYMMFI